MAISGGEPTLNRPWLVRYFRELKILNPDSKARLHLDSNGTILTRDYIDELVMAGVTDIGVEPKGLRAKTFSRITGIEDKNLIRKYQQTQWRAIKHIAENYPDVFLGVGLPYNSAFISLDEVYDFGTKLASIDPEIQLCVLDYFPTFRRKEIRRPNVNEMLKVKEALNDAGLRTVIVQTSKGHIGP
jgi:pyruvate formate lyase activating enzyme